MNRLHSVSWLAIAVSLAWLTATTTNWLLGLVTLGAIVLLSRARSGPRSGAFGWAMVFGAAGLLLLILLGALVGGAAEHAKVLLTLPTWDLGQGITVGGPFTSKAFFVSLERGVDLWVYCALAGLLWQSCPGHRLAALARSMVGRGAQYVAPMVFLGEALAEVGGSRWGRGWASAVASSDQRRCEQWRAQYPQVRAGAGRSVLAGSLGLVTALGLHAIALAGGLRVRMSDNHVTVIGATTVGFGLLVVWIVARIAVGGARPAAGLCLRDVAALGACGLLVATVALAHLTGDAAALAASPAGWPSLPTVSGLVLVGSVAVWIRCATQPSGPDR